MNSKNRDQRNAIISTDQNPMRVTARTPARSPARAPNMCAIIGETAATGPHPISQQKKNTVLPSAGRCQRRLSQAAQHHDVGGHDRHLRELREDERARELRERARFTGPRAESLGGDSLGLNVHIGEFGHDTFSFRARTRNALADTKIPSRAVGLGRGGTIERAGRTLGHVLLSSGSGNPAIQRSTGLREMQTAQSMVAHSRSGAAPWPRSGKLLATRGPGRSQRGLARYQSCVAPNRTSGRYNLANTIAGDEAMDFAIPKEITDLLVRLDDLSNRK